ncbi:50S ribosomal protein L6P, partial [mine drainage metagenome]
MSTETTEAVIEVPAGVRLEVHPGLIQAKGPLGQIVRPFPSDALDLVVADGKATLTLKLPPGRKQSRSLLATWAAHLKNLVGGLTLGVEAKMKVVAA